MWYLRFNMRRHRAAGISVPQFRTLALIDRCPRATLSMVAENLGSTLPTASRLVSGLVRKGLLAREECRKDRRKLSLKLTGRGRQVLNVAREGTQRTMAEILEQLSHAQRGTIASAAEMLQQLFCGQLLESLPFPAERKGGKDAVRGMNGSAARKARLSRRR